MTGGSLRIGSVRGIPVRIHYTFLLVLPFLAIGFGRVFTETARVAGVPAGELGSPFLWGLVVALALFLSVLVHELAHSLYALRKGGRVRDITLLMIGGVSQITELPRTGRHEAVMALVGPLASLVLGGVFFLAHRVLSGTPWLELTFAAFHLMVLNVVLGLFNLLPAFPMDGGRILRGILAERRGIVDATRTAAAAGKVFAVLFAIVGFLSINILLVVIAFFVWVGAEAESRGVLVKALLGQLQVRDLVVSRPRPADSSSSVFDVGERMLRERRLAFPVVDGAEVIGVVALEDVNRVAAGERGRTRVAEIVRRAEPLEGSAEASKALRALAETASPAVAVVEDGALLGTLSHADVARALQLSELEATQHGREEPPLSGLLRHRERHA
jgi:Zn-dependent protease/CBS domain-containing protein